MFEAPRSHRLGTRRILACVLGLLTLAVARDARAGEDAPPREARSAGVRARPTPVS